MSNRYYAVCGIVEIDGKILFVRHTYGTAKEKILLPGGYVKEGELPSQACEREFFEETSIKTHARSVFAAQFMTNQWCIVFVMDFLSGKPVSDGYENSEVLLLTPEAVERTDITNMSRHILRAYIAQKDNQLQKGDYIPDANNTDPREIYGTGISGDF